MSPAADLDAVTVDAFGTLVELSNTIPLLERALAERGVSRPPAAIEEAFAAEAAYYVRHSVAGGNAAGLATLQRDCTGVFLSELGVDLDPDDFAPAYVAALEFRLVEGASEALGALRGAGLSLACVANWDMTLPLHLERLGVAHFFQAVAVSAVVGAEKPDPAIFRFALDRLGVPPERALHIGDNDRTDGDGARAAGLAFEPVPLSTLPERLGL